jgi:hypothetical protein
MRTTDGRSPMKNRVSIMFVPVLVCSISSSLGTYVGAAMRWIEERKLHPRLTGL